MATVKKGVLTKTGRWWKHLRWTKRSFWKGERQAVRKLIRSEGETGARGIHGSQSEVPGDD